MTSCFHASFDVKWCYFALLMLNFVCVEWFLNFLLTFRVITQWSLLKGFSATLQDRNFEVLDVLVREAVLFIEIFAIMVNTRDVKVADVDQAFAMGDCVAWKYFNFDTFLVLWVIFFSEIHFAS